MLHVCTVCIVLYSVSCIIDLYIDFYLHLHNIYFIFIFTVHLHLFSFFLHYSLPVQYIHVKKKTAGQTSLKLREQLIYMYLRPPATCVHVRFNSGGAWRRQSSQAAVNLPPFFSNSPMLHQVFLIARGFLSREVETRLSTLGTRVSFSSPT